VRFSYFLVGLGIGAAIGLLFAPHSGRETRQKLREHAEEGKDYLTEKGEELRSRADHYLEKGKETVGRKKETLTAAIEAGKQAYRAEKRRM
ncbi:MAG: YtxH domain-containing protein, partial [Terriglobia bacterium]